MKQDFPPSLFNELQLVINCRDRNSMKYLQDTVLTSEEKQIVTLYLKSGSCRSVVIQYNISELDVYFKIRNAMAKLNI